MKSFFNRFRYGESSKVVVNGKSYVGNTVSVVNGCVIVDGVQQEGTLPERIQIQVYGNVDQLETQAGDVTVAGTVGSLTTTAGDVSCDNIGGNVSTTAGDINCGNVSGSVKTVAGDVNAKAIIGAVSTVSGDIST